MDKKAGNRKKMAQNISALVFSSLSLIGILVCFICDKAINGTLNWSLIAISAILFGWLVLIPILKFWNKGILGSLVALTILIFPFLMILDRLLGTSLLLPIGVRMAVIGMVFLWVVFALFMLLRKRRWLAAGISVLLMFPALFLINWVLMGILGGAFLDSWDALTFLSIGIVAVIFFGLDYQVVRRRKRK